MCFVSGINVIHIDFTKELTYFNGNLAKMSTMNDTGIAVYDILICLNYKEIQIVIICQQANSSNPHHV